MKLQEKITIGNNELSDSSKVYVIAELSANHEQNLELAINTVKAMKDAGADAVKLQTYAPEDMSLDSDKPWFMTREDSLWAGQRLVDLYAKGETPWDWHEKLQHISNDLGMDFFSTPFSPRTVDLLESIDVPAYKIASFEIHDIPLIKKVAQQKKPIIMSTGIATLEDVDLAIQTCLNEGNNQIALLKCTSAYPTPYTEVNLNTMKMLKERYGCVIGLSDHTLGTTVPVASVALGAKIIEKHFILDRNSEGLDKEFSLMPQEFKAMVDAVRITEQALGSSEWVISEKTKSAQRAGRSIFAAEDIQAGEEFTLKNIKVLRPNRGLHPKYYEHLVGTKAPQFIERGTPITADLVTISL